MKAHIERTEEEKEISFTGTVQELLEKLDLIPEAHLVSRNNELLTKTDIVHDEDKVVIMPVISGG